MLPRIHFIGIGGIGVSALARWHLQHGSRVTGSDLARSEITTALQREGASIRIGRHRRGNVGHGTTRLIATVAAAPDNPEILEARRRGIPVQSYAEALGDLTRERKTVAVAGAHGKSTTTALVALSAVKGRLDPTVIVGTKLREFGDRNFRSGASKLLIMEADEYRGSFLHHTPDIAIVINIDREHLDCYGTVRRIEAAFLSFLKNLKPRGTAVLNREDLRLRKIGASLTRARPDCRVLWFSTKGHAAGRIRRTLRIPGEHNVANAAAAYTACRALGIPAARILAAFRAYRGAWRRFDYRGMFADAKVFADYAHHPTEIRATLQGARQMFPRARIWCVFQPHHYERLRSLFHEFSHAFSNCDRLVLLDVYEVAGREQRGKERVGSEKLAAAIRRRGQSCDYLGSGANLAAFLRRHLKAGDILIMMGAGSIWDMTKKLMAQKQQKPQREQGVHGGARNGRRGGTGPLRPL